MTNHLALIQELQKKRYALLLKAWEDANYTEKVEVSFDSIRNHYGWSDEEASLLMRYLREEELLQWNNGRVYLTHKGVVEIEQSIANPQRSTEHFQAQVIQHYHGSVGAVQNAPHSKAAISHADEVRMDAPVLIKELRQLVNALPQQTQINALQLISDLEAILIRE